MGEYMKARALLLGIAVAFVVAGCGGKQDNGTASASKEAPTVAAASVDGAMCGEHGVLEALCTKCNPALVPVFQAKGDWCAEHGFPESICPICHPERGGRPAVELTSDEPPADGTKVRFKTKETAQLAGLGIAIATESSGTSYIEAIAMLVYDATHEARVNARAPGVVRAVRADVGSKVRAGSPLAVIESAGVGADQSRLKAVASRVQVAEANYKRLSGLRDEGIVAERDVLEARRELDEATAEMEAVRSALGVVESVSEGSGQYTLTSPLAGVVTKRNVAVGRVVTTEEILFEIVESSGMWAEIDISEIDLPLVAVGRPVSITVDGLGDREFKGTLSYVAPEIDRHTRTVKGRVALRNPDGALRANMFGRARIGTAVDREAVMVPRTAVQRARGAHLVFVKLAEDVYEARRIQVLSGDGGWVTVSGRIKAGDEVVTEGSFLLKTETLKESIGAGCCDVE